MRSLIVLFVTVCLLVNVFTALATAEETTQQPTCQVTSNDVTKQITYPAIPKTLGRTGYAFTSIPDRAFQQAAASAGKPRLVVKSRPIVTRTVTRATVDSEGVVEGTTEQFSRRSLFPVFRRSRIVWQQ